MKKLLLTIGTALIFSFGSIAIVSASPNHNTNTNTNNSASNSESESNALGLGFSSSDQRQGQSANNDQGQAQGQQGVGFNNGDGNGIGNDNSTTTYQAADIPVATAYAPALTTSNDTCMGSTSVGAQGLLFGLSFGTTWTDNDCITRKDSRFMHNAGHRTVALSLMCGKESVRAAVARAGTPEQIGACSITEDEIVEYRTKPVIVTVERFAPDED